MLINEYRLTPVDPKARKFLEAEMEKFFFGAGSERPADYKPPGMSPGSALTLAPRARSNTRPSDRRPGSSVGRAAD